MGAQQRGLEYTTDPLQWHEVGTNAVMLMAAALLEHFIPPWQHPPAPHFKGLHLIVMLCFSFKLSSSCALGSMQVSCNVEDTSVWAGPEHVHDD